MSNKLLSALAGLALIAGTGIAQAGEPVALTPAQMEGVTAAGYVCCYVPAHIVLKSKIVIRVYISTNVGGHTYSYGASPT